METIEDYIVELNATLYYKPLYQRYLFDLLNELRQRFKVSLSIIDLKQWKDRFQVAQKEKINAVRLQNFKEAAKWREEEKEFISFFEKLSEFQMQKSMFYLDDNHIFFIYLGNTQNDKKVKSLLKRFAADHYKND